MKVIFDAIPSMNAFGFLIGEPEKYHLKRYSTKIMLKRWKLRDILETKDKKKEAEKEGPPEED